MDDRLASAVQELLEEQRQLTATRNDYVTISRSKFHALRMLWFSFKQMFGLVSERDLFATWSPNILPTLVSQETARVSVESFSAPAKQALTPETARLADAWKARQAGNALSSDPTVSVVIPAYNHADVTARCLRSITDTWFDSLKVQIVLVDDASLDETGAMSTELPGLDYLRNGSNQGFIHSCNRGAAISRGKYICFLNNDTTVEPGWLDHLVSRAESDDTIGVVGAKLVYPNGTLQEAGGIIFRDGTGWNYGRNENPADGKYNYVRDVDYCSGAALLVRADIFRAIGGFSETFAPAYYEDVDLCFAARSLGYRVVFEPRSVVIHYEGVSSGTDTSSGVKKYQEINLPKFRNKWAGVLGRHELGDAKNVPLAARRLRTGQTLLVVDSYVPLHDKDAGSIRLFRIIKMMKNLGYHVVFLPDNYAALQPYTSELQAMGVEVLHHVDGGRRLEQALEEVLPLVDAAWICRPQLYEKYEPLVRRNPAVKLLYDTIDLHFMREKRESELLANSSTLWENTRSREIKSAASADATIVVSDDEKHILNSYGITNVAVIPTIHEIESSDVPGFSEREGILFIGGYNHTPNVDAARWLCLDVMPLVWQRLPGVTVTLLGSSPTSEVLALASDAVRVTGYIANVEPYFLRSRVFVAPMRFGAGMKGKVGHSLAYGLPVVTTTIGSEGFGLKPDVHFLLAQDAPDFADAVVRLYSDRMLWDRLSRASSDAIAPYTSAAVAPTLHRILNDVLEHSGRIG